MRILILVAVLNVFPPALQAGTAVGKVSTILLANNSNAVLFRLDVEIEDSPRCNKEERFAIDLRQVGGGALYNALLDAKAHGYTVSVTGLNTCSVQLESEGVKNIEFR
jgi:hypothetical protein